MVAALALAPVARPLAQANTSIRITSPLGRTGVTGVIRIVAQVVTPAPGGVVPVRFFVDGQQIGEDVDGPPYVAEWVDENPYQGREIRAEADDLAGGVVSDAVSLHPLEVIEETRVASVLLEASVLDEQGKYVRTLYSNDFNLLENDEAQQLDLVRLETVPTTFTLLVDSSQSMARRTSFVRAAARRVVSKLKKGDAVIVAPFRRTVESITGPTNDAATIGEAISAIQSKGGTAILDSITELPDLFQGVAGRHVVILLTDGYDEHSRTPYERAVQSLQRLQATVYVVGIGGVAGISLKGEQLLKRIAREMGGKAFFPAREEQLPEVHDAVASDVYQRYVITYTPSNQEPDGAYRAITLTTSDPTHIVRTRPGYFAPRPPPVRPAIEFTARTANDDFVQLAAEDLRVVEDGVEQTIESFQEAVAPMSIVMALDGSGSMRRSLDAVKEAARTFVRSLRPTDPLALVHFADRVVFEHDLSLRRELSLESIDQHQAAGGTALWDALYDSMSLLKLKGGRRAVVVMTDGRDENGPGTAPGSRHTLQDVLDRVRETETSVYAIALGANVDREALARIAAESGGEAYFPEDVTTLDAQYARVLENLRRRYVLNYTSTNTRRDGGWRTVEVTATRPDIVIRSPGGYFAPGRVTATEAPAAQDRPGGPDRAGREQQQE
jgi:VWFA-related protein